MGNAPCCNTVWPCLKRSMTLGPKHQSPEPYRLRVKAAVQLILRLPRRPRCRRSRALSARSPVAHKVEPRRLSRCQSISEGQRCKHVPNACLRFERAQGQDLITPRQLFETHATSEMRQILSRFTTNKTQLQTRWHHVRPSHCHTCMALTSCCSAGVNGISGESVLPNTNAISYE
jgi:hypothetical protein